MTNEAKAYRLALLGTLIALAVLALVAIPVSWWLDGSAGAVAASVGWLLAAVSSLGTQAAMIVGHKRKPEVFAAIVGGAWLAKMLVFVIALAILQDVEGFLKVPFAATALVGVLASVVIDALAVRRAKVSYV